MKILNCFKHAFEMVLHSKLRSWLTILGIVIGVAAVIAIVSIGEGLRQSVNNQLGNLGGDILTLTAGAPRGNMFFGGGGDRGPGGFGGGGTASLTTKNVVLQKSDYQVIKGLPDVALIDTNIRGQVNVSYLDKAGKVSLTGVDQRVWSQITTLTLANGRWLGPTDQNVIVIGGRLASTYFTTPVGINNVITIQGGAYRVVGILSDSSTNIYMPLQLAYQVIPQKTIGQYDTVVIKVKDQNYLNQTITEITDALMTSRHVTTKTQDFSIESNAQAQATRASALSSINAFLLAIAAVSLLVGAVGVANTMFTSVLEKTKEIGIMKAIGAKNRDILLIFVFNAALIGLIGGFIGIILGIILSGFLPALMGTGIGIFARGGTYVSLNSIIVAISVSIVVGIAAGIVPAYQASKLKPVDALRYE